MISDIAQIFRIMQNFNSIIAFGLVLLMFACDSITVDEDVIPAQRYEGDTGGDDEDPIIQGGIVFPDDFSESDTLVSVTNVETAEVIASALTDENGEFSFAIPRATLLRINLVSPDGYFRYTEPFTAEDLPALLVIN